MSRREHVNRQPRTAMLIAAALAVLGCETRTQPVGVPTVQAAAALPTRVPAPTAPATPSCGLAGQPDCPLQQWMDHELNAPLSRGDYAAVARAFRDLAAATPEGFGGWGAWAQGGAVAADRRDHDGVNRACKGCHNGYRERYRQTMRERPLPAADPP